MNLTLVLWSALVLLTTDPTLGIWGQLFTGGREYIAGSTGNRTSTDQSQNRANARHRGPLRTGPAPTVLHLSHLIARPSALTPAPQQRPNRARRPAARPAVPGRAAAPSRPSGSPSATWQTSASHRPPSRGRVHAVSASGARSAKTKGTKMLHAGMRLGRLTIIRATNRRIHRSVVWEAICDCGTVVEARRNDFTSGNTSSCGCARTKHEHAKKGRPSPTYRSWCAMIKRCQDPNSVDYMNYGGRGIRVCERWVDFQMFLEDMGERPKGMTLDRKDNNSNYQPENCRWATVKSQSNNKRTNRILDVNGVRMTLTEWSECTKIGLTTIRQRLVRGWDACRAVTEPTR